MSTAALLTHAELVTKRDGAVHESGPPDATRRHSQHQVAEVRDRRRVKLSRRSFCILCSSNDADFGVAGGGAYLAIASTGRHEARFLGTQAAKNLVGELITSVAAGWVAARQVDEGRRMAYHHDFHVFGGRSDAASLFFDLQAQRNERRDFVREAPRTVLAVATPLVFKGLGRKWFASPHGEICLS